MSKINALITGITGMVGSHLADYLLENTDWNIYGMRRWRSSLKNIEHLSQRINNKDRVFLIGGDLLDFFSLQKVITESKPDYVFHLASQSYPTTSFSSPISTLDTNILGTLRLLEAIKQNSTISPVIHICSSSEVFGRVKKENLPIDEECPFSPASPYSISKIGTDLLGKFYYEAYNQKILITRMFTHSGPRRGDVFVESNFAKQIAMIESDLIPPIVKVGNLDSLRTWADVRDAVRAYHTLVIMHPPRFGECYNIGGEYSCTVGEMLNYLLSQSLRKDITIEQEEDRLRPLDADLQVPNTKKFRNYTGWKPEISFQTTMFDLLNYWRREVGKGNIFL